MSQGDLQGKCVAILAEDNYEDLELWYPLLRFREAGADVTVIGMSGVEVYHSKHGYPVKVDAAAGEVSAEDFDAVVIPGGYAPDRMRRHPPMLELVKGIFERGGVVAFATQGGCLSRQASWRANGSRPYLQPKTIWSMPGRSG